jgi:hypothetical protein
MPLRQTANDYFVIAFTATPAGQSNQHVVKIDSGMIEGD